MSEWIEQTLEETLVLQRGFDLPFHDREDGQYPIIASTGKVGTHSKPMVLAPGVVIGRSGSLGGGQYVREDFWPLNTTLWVKDFKGNDPRFCYYLLSSLRLSEFNAGGAVPTLNRNHIAHLRVRIPSSVSGQRAIAGVLGDLDDKIELNRRMNDTLEAMARAIFQSWFVDFDPVRAKAGGESPDSICRRLGLTPELLALFPDELVDSELGAIPAGWEVGSLDQLLVLQRGFDLPAGDRRPGCYPILAASGPSGAHDEFMVRGPGVTTGRSGVLGKSYYVHEDYWPLNTSLWVKEFKRAKPAYAFHLLQCLDFKSLNAGSAVPTLNRNHAHAVRVVVPPQAIVDAFEPVATALLSQQKANLDLAANIAEVRDSLLPKLLSGELTTTDKEGL